MTRPVSKTPTPAEVEVLEVLWSHGPRTLRQVQELLPGKLTRAAVFGRLESMMAKGLIKLRYRSKGEGGSEYLAIHTRDGTMGRMFAHLSRLFGGTPKALLQGLLRDGEVTEEDLKDLKVMMKEQQKRKKDR